MAKNICGGISGTEYTRYYITTVMLEEFIKQKVAAVLQDQDCDDQYEVYCFPQVIGNTQNGIKYATMCICMNGIGESGDTLYDQIKMFNYRPRINRGVQNAIVKAYEFPEEKLRSYLENPKQLRKLCLSPKDVDFLHQHRRLQMNSVQNKPFYMFYADMDRILDDFLMDADADDPVIPNYTVLSIKSLGDKPDSPLGYDVIVTDDPKAEADNAAEVFKALVSPR